MLIENSWPFNMTDTQAAILIPTIVTILVFVLGILFNWGYNKIQQYRSIKTYRRIVFEWTDLIIEAVLVQSKSLYEFSEGLKESLSILPRRYAFSRSMSNKLNELTAEKVVSAFIFNCRCKRKTEDKRAKFSFNLVSQYDFLSSIEPIVKGVYDSYNQQSNKLLEQWNALMIQMRHDLDAMKAEKMEDRSVVQKLRDVFANNLKNIEHPDLIGVLYERLILPLNQVVEECRRAFPNVRCCQSVYECVEKMLILYHNWHAIKFGYAEVFKTYADSIDKSISSLQEAKIYFEESTKVKMLSDPRGL